MINVHHKTLSITLVLMATISLSACSGLAKLRGALSDDGGVNYQNNQSYRLQIHREAIQCHVRAQAKYRAIFHVHQTD